VSQSQLDAFQTAVVALEVAKNKATKLRKEVGYSENRAKRAEEEVAKLEGELAALKKAASAPPPPAQQSKKQA
jgi:hypothetical protein